MEVRETISKPEIVKIKKTNQKCAKAWSLQIRMCGKMTFI